MKMAKKVLSVVLAVLMALSCFAVASSAYTGLPYDDAEKHATIWMTAGVDAGSKNSTITSNTKFTFKDPADISLTEVTAEGGDTVYVYLYATADYYVEQFSCNIFMPAGWTTPSERLHAISGQENKNWSTSNKKKIFYSTEHELTTIYTISMLTLFNEWESITAEGRADVAKCWPTDANGDILPAFGNEDGSANQNKWKFVLFNQMAYEDAEYAVMPQDEDNWIVRIPIYIPTDVKDGTYQILIPEECAARADKPKGFNVMTEMLDADEEEGFAEDEIYPERLANKWMYDKDGTFQYIDFSGACITVKIGDDEPKLVYTGIDAAITAFEELTESDWTAESWGAAVAAYDDAVDAKANATTQKALDDAAAALNAAIEALEEPAIELDYTGLEEAIEATADVPDEDTFTAASWADYIDALSAANALNSARDAADQDEIDGVTNALWDAIDGLKLAADTAELEEAVAAALAADEADYSASDWSTLQGYVADAEDNYIGKDLAAEDAQTAIDNLAAAINALLENKLDKTALEAAIAAADEFKAEAYAANYTEDSWSAFDNALTAAREAMNADSQQEINVAAAALTAAQAGLVEADADYTALENAISYAEEELNEADFKAGWDAVQTALAAAKAVPTGLKAKDQATINEAADDLNAAIENLTPWGEADTSALVAAMNRPVEYEAEYYTEESLAAYETAADVAFTLLNNHNLTEADQDDIDAAAAAVNAAYDALELKPADTTDLFAAIAEADAINADYVVSKDDVDAAVAAANTLLANDLTILDQAAIADAANAIRDAIANLAWLTADYSALNEAKEIVESLVPEFYYPDLLDDVMTAYNTACDVADDLLKADQWKVDAAAETLWAALDALEMLPADYTAVNAAITAANKVKETTKVSSTVTYNNYTDDSWAAFATAKATAEALDADRYIEYQGEIDAATTALTEAQANLVWADNHYDEQAASYVTEYEALEETAYTAETWAPYAAAIEALEAFENGTMENFKDMMSAINAVKKAKNALVEAEIIPDDADYTELDAALRRFEALTQSDWTGDSWALAASAYDYAASIDRDLTEASQDVINDAAAALNDAIDNLVAYVEPAIKTALKEAIDRCDEIEDFSIYTDETAQAVQEAYSAAVALYDDETLTFDDQDAIDNAANALNDALDNLKLIPVIPVLADVTALQAAIEAAEKLTADDYTEETWSVLAEAVRTGQAFARAELEDSEAARQAIAEATEAIYDAIDALEEKSTEPEEPAKGDVQKVEVTSEPVVAGEAQTFEVTVKDRAMMVQFIEADHGDGTGTRTFDRYNENVEIKSYKADGTECSDLDRELAYEVWTITTKLADGEIDVRVKQNGSTVYEPVDVALSFVNEYKALNNEIISAELAATSGAKGPVAYTVVTGADVQAIQFKNQEGETFTMPVEKAADNGDGTLTFTGKVWFHSTGVRTVTLKALDANNGWVDTGITLEYTIGGNKPV